MLREYLIVAAKCKLTARADRLGVKVTYVCQTSETGINIRILLAAFRRFYDYLIASQRLRARKSIAPGTNGSDQNGSA